MITELYDYAYRKYYIIVAFVSIYNFQSLSIYSCHIFQKVSLFESSGEFVA